MHPELSEASALALAMTRVNQHTGRPSVAPYLRGWVDDPPQTRVIWRRVLPLRLREGEGADTRLTRQDEALLGEVFKAFPPHLGEVLETETRLAAGLLKARVAAVFKRGEVPPDLRRLAAVVLAPDNSLDAAFSLDVLNDEETKRLEGRLAGRTLVLDARLGGLNEEGLLDSHKDGAPVTLDAERPAPPGERGWDEVRLQRAGRRLREIDTRPKPAAEEGEAPTAPLKSEARGAEGWVREASWPMSLDDSDSGWVWQLERWAATPEIGDAARASKPQSLEAHQAQAEAAAEAIADALALPPDIRETVVTAAAVHDAGKDRRLWQMAMGAPKDGRPYAKITGKGAAAALLNGYRHEFGSLLTAAPAIEALPEGVRELARHLIVAHHGHGRPVIAPVDPNEPPSASEERSHEVALRFARLQAHWGPWGLAWLEALVRAADWKASRDHQAGESADG